MSAAKATLLLHAAAAGNRTRRNTRRKAGSNGNGVELRPLGDADVLRNLRTALIEFNRSEKQHATLELDIGIFKSGQSTAHATYTTALGLHKSHTDLHTATNPPPTDMSGAFLDIENYCMEVVLDEYGHIATEIKSDSKCFTPALESNSEGTKERVTRTDVLVVLTAKLAILHPYLSKKTPPILMDYASIGPVSMTPFRLLRGLQPFYQKYGLTNASIARIQKLVASATFADIDVHMDIRVNEGTVTIAYGDIIRTLLGASIKADTPLTNVLKRISVDDEISVFEADGIELSSELLKILLYAKGRQFGLSPGKVDIIHYKFHPSSEEWLRWKQRVRITDFRLFESENA
jgi:hypothetical protein